MLTSDYGNQYTIDPDKTKKVILSVDGGGMRGVIAIAMLAELEKRTGRKCQEMFDMVVGTSTGAVIAAGLAVGYSATYLLEEVYYKRLPRAFHATKQRWWAKLLAKPINGLTHVGEDFISNILSNGLKFAYLLDPFREELAPLVASNQICNLGDLKYPEHPIMLITTKDVYTGNTYFMVNAGKGQKYFQEWPLTGIVAASSAAPIFYPPAIGRFVDGGVGLYSNPCLAAATEAMEYIGPFESGQSFQGFKDGNVILISLGTGYIPSEVNEQDKYIPANYNILDWMRYIILRSLDDAALQQVFTTRAIYGKIKDGTPGRIDFRRYNPALTSIKLADELGIDLKGKPDPFQLSLDSYQEDQIRLMEEIGRKYAEKIDWSKPDQMPWDTQGGHPKPDLDNDLRLRPVLWKDTPFFSPRPPVMSS